MLSILCINGSDSTGRSGVQSDIKTAKDLGGEALTAVTSVTVQNQSGILRVHDLPPELVVGQVQAVCDDCRPQAVKIGMVDHPKSIEAIADVIADCPNIVCSPGILSSHGGSLMSEVSRQALRRCLVPLTTLLMLKCTEAEVLLGRRIATDADMLATADELRALGARWVLLRGGKFGTDVAENQHIPAERITALLSGPDHQQFFSSLNIEGWQRHGVGGALSTAIALRLAAGDDVPTAVRNAHAYIHSRVVYAEKNEDTMMMPRSAELYNAFLSLVSDNYRTTHDVAFYADRMAITSRYLSQITRSVAGKSPKRIIDDRLMAEVERLLTTTLLTVQEITNQLGFSSQAQLAKFFHAHRGCSPTAFRQQTAPERVRTMAE